MNVDRIALWVGYAVMGSGALVAVLVVSVKILDAALKYADCWRWFIHFTWYRMEREAALKRMKEADEEREQLRKCEGIPRESSLTNVTVTGLDESAAG